MNGRGCSVWPDGALLHVKPVRGGWQLLRSGDDGLAHRFWTRRCM